MRWLGEIVADENTKVGSIDVNERWGGYDVWITAKSGGLDLSASCRVEGGWVTSFELTGKM